MERWSGKVEGNRKKGVTASELKGDQHESYGVH